MDTSMSMEWTPTKILKPVGIEKVKGATLLGVLETEKGGRPMNKNDEFIFGQVCYIPTLTVKVVDLLCFRLCLFHS